MELTKFAEAIKQELEVELLKAGSSLVEFEHALQNINTGEGVLKIAVDGNRIIDNMITGGMSSAGSIPELAFKGSLAGGALAGLTLGEMDKSVESLHKALAKEREKINLVKRVTQNLKREHGLI